jgi:hypothetical protein
LARLPTGAAERALVAASVAFAPALLALGWLMLPSLDGAPLEELADIEASSGRWVAAWSLILVGALLMVPAAIALGGLVRLTSPVASLAGRILALLGAIGLVATAAARGLHGARLADDARDPLHADGAGEAWDGLHSGALGALAHGPEVMAAGLVLIGLALAQRGPVARQAGWIVALGAAVILVSALFSGTLGAGIGAAVLLVGMLPFARHVAGTEPATATAATPG